MQQKVLQKKQPNPSTFTAPQDVLMPYKWRNSTVCILTIRDVFLNTEPEMVNPFQQNSENKHVNTDDAPLSKLELKLLTTWALSRSHTQTHKHTFPPHLPGVHSCLTCSCKHEIFFQLWVIALVSPSCSFYSVSWLSTKNKVVVKSAGEKKKWLNWTWWDTCLFFSLLWVIVVIVLFLEIGFHYIFLFLS